MAGIRNNGSIGDPSAIPSAPEDDIRPAAPEPGSHAAQLPDTNSHPPVRNTTWGLGWLTCCLEPRRKKSFDATSSMHAVELEVRGRYDIPQLAGSSQSPAVQQLRLGSAQAAARAATPEREFLPLSELYRVMQSGVTAERRSGLVLAHIAAFKKVANATDSILMFRPVNRNATYYIEHFGFPVKGLSIKTKSKKKGLTAGLLEITNPMRTANEATRGVRSRSNESKITLQLSSQRVDLLRARNKLKELPELKELLRQQIGAEADASVFVQERDTDEKRVFRLDLMDPGPEGQRLRVSVRSDNGDFVPLRVEGRHGQPVTADYDLFAILPKIKPAAFAGDVDLTGAARSVRQAQAGTKLQTLSHVVRQDLLGQAQRRTIDPDRGRLTDWQRSIVTRLNEAAREAGYQGGDIVQHGTEQDNTLYPERNEKIFAILPKGVATEPNADTLRTSSWQQVQALMYAARQDGFLVYENRAYNHRAGAKIFYRGEKKSIAAQLKGSGQYVPFDGKAAATQEYGDDRDGINRRSADTDTGSSTMSARSSPQRRGRSNQLLRLATLTAAQSRAQDKNGAGEELTTRSLNSESESLRAESLRTASIGAVSERGESEDNSHER